MAGPQPPCPFCGAKDWQRLPDPARASAVLSDLRCVPEPLAKRGCKRCGYACRDPLAVDSTTLFGADYRLYDRAPSAADRARADRYALWIAGALHMVPSRVLEVGCGNGSLLLALRERWPAASFQGIDPSPQAVRHARAAGLDVSVSALDRSALLDGQADLTVSVNVVEHVADPGPFVQHLAESTRPTGVVALICPDGAIPGLELLFADHLHSFTSDHLRRLCDRAGLRWLSAPGRGPEGFQLAIAARALDDGRAATDFVVAPRPDLVGGKARYLERWQALDGALCERLPANREVVSFGVGEAAGLLRVYTPTAWSRVCACTLDGDLSGDFGGVPIVPLHTIAPPTAVLVATHPADQFVVAERLARERGVHAVVWRDLIAV